MSGISYFQRYSQKENHATNNTLYLFKHIYQRSLKRFSDMLESLSEDDSFDVGIHFDQQVKGSSSVPDGLISQKPFYIYLESKLGSELDHLQIKAHLETITSRHIPKEGDNVYLLGLTIYPLSKGNIDELKKIASQKNIKFFATTYSAIVETAYNLVQNFETDLLEIIDDYNDFLLTEELKPVDDNLLLTVLAGQSLEENLKYNFYYEPAHRPAKWHAKFLGLYADKRVSYVGEIKCVLRCISDQSGEVNIIDDEEEWGSVSDDELRKIQTLMHDENSVYFPSQRDKPHRYYFVEHFYDTNFTKNSKGGMMGHRYFDLKEYGTEPNLDTSKIAELLKNCFFV